MKSIFLFFTVILLIGCTTQEETCQPEEEKLLISKEFLTDENTKIITESGEHNTPKDVCQISELETSPVGLLKKDEFYIDWLAVYCDYISINMIESKTYQNVISELTDRIKGYQSERRVYQLTQFKH